MHTGNITWTGIDDGQEGLLKAAAWLNVLKILSKHEGESHRSLQSPLFTDLHSFDPNRAWTGEHDDRSFFRDYGKSWKDLGALDKNLINTSGEIRLTPLGRNIVNGTTTIADFFRSAIDNYRLDTLKVKNTKKLLRLNPFGAIAKAIIERDGGKPSEIMKRVESIFKASYPSLENCQFDDSATSKRRFRTYLHLLSNSGAVELYARSTQIAILDTEYLLQLAAGSQLQSQTPALTETIDDLDEMRTDNRRREYVNRLIREGQGEFRAQILNAYDSKCAITGVEEESVLEAAHIMNYKGRQTNTANNGILLAVDIHRLFDANRIGIHPDTHRVVLSPELRASRYQPLSGSILLPPVSSSNSPNIDYLKEKYEEFKNAQN